MNYKIPQWSDLQALNLLTKKTKHSGVIKEHLQPVVALSTLRHIQRVLRLHHVNFIIPRQAEVRGFLNKQEYDAANETGGIFGFPKSTPGHHVSFLIIEHLDPTIQKELMDTTDEDFTT